MRYRLTQLLLLGCYIIHYSESIFIYNLTNTNKILCHSCKGSDCEKITNDNDDDNMILCNRNTQLCWAGFVDQQPYRTCASRFCTPSDISLDSDIRIEMCCRSNLCNSVSLSSSIWAKLYKKSSTSRPETSTTRTSTTTPKRTTTTKRRTTVQQFYFVDEILDDRRIPLYKESNEKPKETPLSKLQYNPANIGISWERMPYEKDFSQRVASISKLLILIMPVLIVLLI